MTSVKTVHHSISEKWFGEMVLPKRGFRWFQGISSQSIPSRLGAIYFRETAWLDNSSSVRGKYSCFWKQQTHPAGFHMKRKNPWSTDRLKCTGRVEYLHLRGDFGGALQPTSDASNNDFCESNPQWIKKEIKINSIHKLFWGCVFLSVAGSRNYPDHSRPIEQEGCVCSLCLIKQRQLLGRNTCTTVSTLGTTPPRNDLEKPTCLSTSTTGHDCQQATTPVQDQRRITSIAGIRRCALDDTETNRLK